MGSEPEEEATASHLAAPGCAGRIEESRKWLPARFLRCVSRLEYPDREADSNGESCPFLFLSLAGLFSMIRFWWRFCDALVARRLWEVRRYTRSNSSS